jgi:hypothetical protein
MSPTQEFDMKHSISVGIMKVPDIWDGSLTFCSCYVPVFFAHMVYLWHTPTCLEIQVFFAHMVYLWHTPTCLGIKVFFAHMVYLWHASICLGIKGLGGVVMCNILLLQTQFITLFTFTCAAGGGMSKKRELKHPRGK